MRLESPLLLLLLLLIPLVLVIRHLRKGTGSLRFSTLANVRQLNKTWKQRLAWLPLFFRAGSIAVLIVAIARPQEGKQRVVDSSEGIAIEMLVDRSSSMKAQMPYRGQRQDRLSVVKEVFHDFVMGDGDDLKGRPNDLVGIITFAGYADTVCPLTLGHGAVAQFLKSVNHVEIRSEDGTAIGDAIALAAARLKTAEEDLKKRTPEKRDFKIKSKIIILLTDGQQTKGTRHPVEAAKIAKEWGIKIYAIGVGSADDVVEQNGLFGRRLVPIGEGADQATLEAIAKETGGALFMAEDEKALRRVYEEIDEMERSEVSSVRYMDYYERFGPLAYIALALLVIEIILSNTLFRRLP